VLCEKRTVARFAWFLALRLCCVITQPGHIAHAQSELLNIRSILNCRPCGACFPLLLRLVAWVGGVSFSCSRWLATVFVKQHCAVCRFCSAATEHCWCRISKLYILQCFVCAYVMHLLFVIITLRKLNTVSRLALLLSNTDCMSREAFYYPEAHFVWVFTEFAKCVKCCTIANDTSHYYLDEHCMQCY